MAAPAEFSSPAEKTNGSQQAAIKPFVQRSEPQKAFLHPTVAHLKLIRTLNAGIFWDQFPHREAIPVFLNNEVRTLHIVFHMTTRHILPYIDEKHTLNVVTLDGLVLILFIIVLIKGK